MAAVAVLACAATSMATPAQGARVAAAPAVVARPAAEPVDAQAIEFLRKLGLEQSQVMDHLSWICDVYGPRLTGSPNLRRAQEWAAATFRSWGLANVHLAPWGPFGRGWQLDRFSMHVVGENPWPVLAWPKAWSPTIRDGEVVEAEVVDVSGMSAGELEALDLSDKIVLVDARRDLQEPFEGLAKRLDAEDLLSLATGAPRPRRDDAPERMRDQAREARARAEGLRRQEMMAKVFQKRPLAICDRGAKGDYGTLFVQGAAGLPTAAPATAAVSASAADDRRGARGRRGLGGPPAYRAGTVVVPQLTLAVEHYNRLQRMLQKGVRVRAAVELTSSWFDGDGMEHNVIAEIPGTDPVLGDQLVMLGAHFDSWHSGSGATDNGCGSAVMMEAARLLHELCKARGEGPRRTIRVALWSGEEQGLMGSRAYVRQQFASRDDDGPLQLHPAHAKLSAYYNLDNGTGRIRGVYLQGNEAVGPIFREWLRPFHDLDATTITPGDTGGTDHLSFDAVGLPGFQFIQDPVAYSPRTHHSNMDHWDHAIAADLQQAATIIAAFAWHTAQRDEMLPREPLPQGDGERRGRGGRDAAERRPAQQSGIGTAGAAAGSVPNSGPSNGPNAERGR